MTQGVSASDRLSILACGESAGGCSTCSPAGAHPHGILPPFLIQRSGPRTPKKLKPLFCIPTLAHIEITYACMEDCIMCYNPTRTRVNARDKSVVWSLVQNLAEARVPHTYLIGGEPTYGYSKDELQSYVEHLFENGSSVTIVTNGQVRLKGMTRNLACYGVSIHGADAESHDSITRLKGSWKRAVETAKFYVDEGHDVRIIPVVMGRNHDQMYRIAELAWEIGAEAIYYDVYEPGGIGEQNSVLSDLRMQPTTEELRVAIGQIIRARDDFRFRGDIGFGTALPFCFDERLIERGMQAGCGVGTWFCAVTNTGELRLCNQSRMSFGNILQRPIDKIWLDPMVDSHFRALQWVEEPCASCPVLEECGGGCKVDEGCTSGEFCIDRLVRGLSPEIKAKLKPSSLQRFHDLSVPEHYRVSSKSRFLAMTRKYEDRGDLFYKTRYQTVRIGESEAAIIDSILDATGPISERALVEAYRPFAPEEAIRKFYSGLLWTGALEAIC
ncbi:radical SAM/SPASM domain-containing protein [Sinorhizobium meliloti]|uniref:radical SAM/SPASM domain-containing protein n=1 Tax=Rhizobium meliloti TaxID=382 RepID=UPI00041504AA|nr:radical SAM protein [Sinorhizobium meliloti]